MTSTDVRNQGENITDDPNVLKKKSFCLPRAESINELFSLIDNKELNLIKNRIQKDRMCLFTSVEGCTPLVYACSKDSSYDDISIFLIEAGADVNEQSTLSNPMTPLEAACKNRNENLVKQLVKHGAHARKSMNLQDFEFLDTILNKLEREVLCQMEQSLRNNRIDWQNFAKLVGMSVIEARKLWAYVSKRANTDVNAMRQYLAQTKTLGDIEKDQQNSMNTFHNEIYLLQQNAY